MDSSRSLFSLYKSVREELLLKFYCNLKNPLWKKETTPESHSERWNLSVNRHVRVCSFSFTALIIGQKLTQNVHAYRFVSQKTIPLFSRHEIFFFLRNWLEIGKQTEKDDQQIISLHIVSHSVVKSTPLTRQKSLGDDNIKLAFQSLPLAVGENPYWLWANQKQKQSQSQESQNSR